MPWPVYNYSTQPEVSDLVSPDVLEEITNVEDIKTVETVESIGNIINVKTDELNAIEAIDKIVTVVEDDSNNVVDVQPTKFVSDLAKKWKPGGNPLRRKEFINTRL